MRPLRVEPAPRGPRRGVRDRRQPGARTPLAPDYNVAPTKEVYAVVERPPVARRRAPEPPQRQLRVLTWGLVPSWAKDPSIGNRMINARMETVAEKPAFKRAFAKRRCLLPADGYFEWYPTEREDQGRQAAQAAVLHPAAGRRRAGDGRALRDLARPDQGRGRPRPVPLDLHGDHHRGRGRPRPHPRPDAADGRAGPLGAPGSTRAPRGPTLLDLLVPAAPGRLEAYPVSTLVSNVRNNGPELLEPLPLEEVSS